MVTPRSLAPRPNPSGWVPLRGRSPARSSQDRNPPSALYRFNPPRTESISACPGMPGAGRSTSTSTPAAGLSERIDKPRRRSLPEPHDRIFGLVESESSLRGQPFGQVLCDQKVAQRHRWLLQSSDPPPSLAQQPTLHHRPKSTGADRLRSMHAPPQGDRTALDDDAAYKGGTVPERWDHEPLMIGVEKRLVRS